MKVIRLKEEVKLYKAWCSFYHVNANDTKTLIAYTHMLKTLKGV